MNAIILSIGDELVLGQTVDTNSAWLSQQLAAIGCRVVAHITVGDDQQAIEQALLESVGRCDCLLVTGGIGPTPDDLTRQALAEVMKAPLERNDNWMEKLLQFFNDRGREMPASNRIQAMIPRGVRMIENGAGTAAGMDAAYQSPDLKTTCRIFVMPGVPKEMKLMFERDVQPQLSKGSDGAAIVSRTLHTFGLGESWVAEKLGELMERGRNPSVGTTVANGYVSLRINAHVSSGEVAGTLADRSAASCREKLGDVIFGEEDQTLPDVVAKLLCEGRPPTSAARGQIWVATAESCTGGLLAKMLTDVPGSSNYFKQGWITYSNDAKTRDLGVDAPTIDEHGAVSVEVARAMAEGALRVAGADIALSITGVAGPGGGTIEKPVGTVCIGLADRTGPAARQFNFPGDREMIRDRSAKMALSMLRYHLLGKPMPF